MWFFFQGIFNVIIFFLFCSMHKQSKTYFGGMKQTSQAVHTKAVPGKKKTCHLSKSTSETKLTTVTEPKKQMQTSWNHGYRTQKQKSQNRYLNMNKVQSSLKIQMACNEIVRLSEPWTPLKPWTLGPMIHPPPLSGP